MNSKVLRHILIGFGALLFILVVFRIQLLQGIGQFLIKEDTNEPVEVVFVLGGNSYDRGAGAIHLLNQGIAKQAICLGENVPTIFKAINVDLAESEVTQQHMWSLTNDSSSVGVLKVGTSTFEEAEAILNYSKEKGYDTIMVLSDKFHTRRIHRVFKKKFKKEGITVLIVGSPSSIYRESEWWKSEEGLIMVNNEYVKLLYYLLKY
jgi:uncharacterized SAM-binding protein YcdF (DUF218 family)